MVDKSVIFLAVRSAVFFRAYAKKGFNNIVKDFLLSFTTIDYGDLSVESGSDIFFCSPRIKKRPDLMEMQELFFEWARTDNHKIIKMLPSRKINIMNIFYFFYMLFNKEYKGIDRRDLFYVVHIYTTIYRLYKKIDRLENNRKLYVFCDSVGVDAAIASLATSCDFKVYTIQHGQYKYDPRIKSSDDVPFFNINSSKILIWGDRTFNEYMRAGISKDKLVVYGRFSKKNKIEPVRSGEIKKITAVLNGPDKASDNFKMICFAKRIAEINNLSFTIRKHPADKMVYKAMLLDQGGISNSTLYVCHSSGFVLDCILKGVPFVIYNNLNTPSIYKDLGVDFFEPESVSIRKLIDERIWEKVQNEYAKSFIKNSEFI